MRKWITALGAAGLLVRGHHRLQREDMERRRARSLAADERFGGRAGQRQIGDAATVVEAVDRDASGSVKVGDRDVKLSPKEYELLRVLVQHAGKVLTHRFLLKELWDELTDAQYLRVYVRQLRQKIEADPERPQFVLTETGIGYRLRAPD